MVPRIISQIGTNLTVEMPIPYSIAKEKFSVKQWALCYGEGSIERHILLAAAKYNATLIDIKMLWIRCNFYYELFFEDASNFENFKNEIHKILNEKL